MKGTIELSAFVLLIIGTLGLVVNEYIFDWGSFAALTFAALNVMGLAILSLVHWGVKH